MEYVCMHTLRESFLFMETVSCKFKLTLGIQKLNSQNIFHLNYKIFY